MRKIQMSLFLALSLSSTLGFSATALSESARATRAARITKIIKASLAQKAPGAKGAVADLIARAKSEKDAALQKMVVTALLKLKLPLRREQKRDVLQLIRNPVNGLLPKAPPIPATGQVEIRHYSMDGFLAADLAAMKAAGFTVKEGINGAEATKGRIHVVIRETGTDVLRDLADANVHMITYVGHSQIGGTVEQALQQAGLTGPKARKLVALFQCVGTQTLPLLKAKAPMADVITSNDPLFIDEIPNFVRELYTSIDKGENYHQISRRFEKVAWKKGRLVSPNQTATLDSVDFDANGELDVKEAPGTIEILPAKLSRAAQQLMSGVHYLRTLNPYYADETPGAVFTRTQAAVPLVSKGLAEKSIEGGGVTQIVDTSAAGKQTFEISLDPKYENEDPTFIGAAAVYELQMHLQRTLLKKNDARAQARAMAFTGEYLQLMPRDGGVAQAALDKLTALKGLRSITMYDMNAALYGDHILNEQQVDRVAKLIAPVK